MIYQYIWKYNMAGKRLRTIDGKPVEVLYPGLHNRDSGPDFSGARLRIGGTEWCGNVEIHVKASDWYRHKHDTDPAYSNVVLHVVGVNDTRVTDSNGQPLTQAVVSFPESFARLYARLSENISSVKCEPLLGRLGRLTVTGWMSSLAVERLQMKAQRIALAAESLGGNWEQACFASLARALGFGLNSEPLEMLARSTPLNFIARHSDDLFQIEALLFGQAGLLDTSIHIFDGYYQKLCREYFFLARKYGLRPMRRDMWKYSKTRPQNFPARRIAMLAKAAEGGFALLSELMSRSADPDSIRDILNWELGGYWLEHYDFDIAASRLSPRLSASNTDLLLINFAAPVIYAYGSARGDSDMAGRGLDIWEEVRSENNTIIRQWAAAGLPCENAADSQALLQLRREHCDKGKCLDCRFGHALLRNEIC